MKDTKTVTIKMQRGIDDLKGIYAWRGNSQGDESYTNDVKVGQASGGWMTFMFDGIDSNDQQAINEESVRRQKVNEEYIALLKKEGRYGEEYEVNYHIKVLSILDNPHT